jgi:cysteine desulfurase
MKAFLDNAATTRLDPEVLAVMLPFLTHHFGNPSSIHADGRKVRSAIERARKAIAEILNAAPAEIFFTSGGTEADNTAIRGSIEAYDIKHVISSPLEHHAVLHTLQHLEKRGIITLSMVNADEKGVLDLGHLEQLMEQHPRSLISLMHGNNEIGNLLDLQHVSMLCHERGAIFHSDTVQTMGHYVHDLQEIKANFIVGAAHKFHGPKGIGFLYISPGTKIPPFLHGGAQERNMRGGTENVYGIVGLAKALEIAYRDMAEHTAALKRLKQNMIGQLREQIPGVEFNGLSADPDRSLYTVLSVSLPPSDINDMLLFNLDIAGIAASGGSACASGSEVGSHVLMGIKASEERAHVRFSFSKYTTAEETDYAVKTLAKLYEKI